MRKIILTIILTLLPVVNAYAGAFNGSGVFVRSYNWTNDATNGIPITASRFDTEDTGFATGLSTCITKDGQQTITANIPFSNFGITGLANPSTLQGAVTAYSLINGTLTYGTATGSGTAITLTTSPAIGT